MTYQLRKAYLGDVERIFAIRLTVKENVMNRDELNAIGITESFIMNAIEMGLIWVVDFNGLVLGFSLVNLELAYVNALFVDPDYEGKGVGSCLLEAAENHLFALYDTIYLETDSQSRASHLYRKRAWFEFEDKGDGDLIFAKRKSLE